MGIFYTNVVLYGPDQSEIKDYLNKLNRISYISPTEDKFTVIYDQETEDQNTDVVRKLTEKLSNKFGCPALSSLVHDGDIFMYWLYDSGELLDTYNSIPGYFDTTIEKSMPEGGDAAKLCEAFDVPTSKNALNDIFKLVERTNIDDDWSDEYLNGEDIHRELAQVLGMPPFAVNIGFYTIENDYLPDDLEHTDFTKIEPNT